MSTEYFLVDEVSNSWWQRFGDVVGGFGGTVTLVLTALVSVCGSHSEISIGCGWWHPWKLSRGDGFFAGNNGSDGTLGRSASIEWMGLVALLKMPLSCLSATLVCVSAGGRSGCQLDLPSAAVRSLAAAMMVSFVVAVGILMLWGNQSTVLTTWVALVDGV
jgi:hypothetical protein